MSKKSSPNTGGWTTTKFLNMIYDPNKMSTFSKDNVTKALKKGAGIVIFAVAVNMIGEYTVRQQPFPVYNATMAGKVLVAGTAGILATEYAEAKWMAKS